VKSRIILTCITRSDITRWVGEPGSISRAETDDIFSVLKAHQHGNVRRASEFHSLSVFSEHVKRPRRNYRLLLDLRPHLPN
jgi:hypothetical protein